MDKIEQAFTDAIQKHRTYLDALEALATASELTRFDVEPFVESGYSGSLELLRKAIAAQHAHDLVECAVRRSEFRCDDAFAARHKSELEQLECDVALGLDTPLVRAFTAARQQRNSQ